MDPDSRPPAQRRLAAPLRLCIAYLARAVAAATSVYLADRDADAARLALLAPVVLVPAIWLYLTCEDRRPGDRVKHGGFLLPASIPLAYLLWLLGAECIVMLRGVAFSGAFPGARITAAGLLLAFLPALLASYAALVLTGPRSAAGVAPSAVGA